MISFIKLLSKIVTKKGLQNSKFYKGRKIKFFMSLEQSLSNENPVAPWGYNFSRRQRRNPVLERYESIRKLSEGKQDDFLKECLENLFEDALRYVEIVSTQNSKIAAARDSDLNQKEYLELVERLGNSRRRKHQSIISQINMVHRLISKDYGINPEVAGLVPGCYQPEKGIFSDDPQGNDRQILKDWCYELTRGYYDD